MAEMRLPGSGSGRMSRLTVRTEAVRVSRAGSAQDLGYGVESEVDLLVGDYQWG